MILAQAGIEPIPLARQGDTCFTCAPDPKHTRMQIYIHTWHIYPHLPSHSPTSIHVPLRMYMAEILTCCAKCCWFIASTKLSPPHNTIRSLLTVHYHKRDESNHIYGVSVHKKCMCIGGGVGGCGAGIQNTHRSLIFLMKKIAWYIQWFVFWPSVPENPTSILTNAFMTKQSQNITPSTTKTHESFQSKICTYLSPFSNLNYRIVRPCNK